MPKNNSLTSIPPLFKFMGIGAYDLIFCGEVIESFSLYNYCSPPVGEHFFAGVAQLVEQLIRNQQVSSSSLLAGSFLSIGC